MTTEVKQDLMHGSRSLTKDMNTVHAVSISVINAIVTRVLIVSSMTSEDSTRLVIGSKVNGWIAHNNFDRAVITSFMFPKMVSQDLFLRSHPARTSTSLVALWAHESIWQK